MPAEHFQEMKSAIETGKMGNFKNWLNEKTKLIRTRIKKQVNKYLSQDWLERLEEAERRQNAGESGFLITDSDLFLFDTTLFSAVLANQPAMAKYTCKNFQDLLNFVEVQKKRLRPECTKDEVIESERHRFELFNKLCHDVVKKDLSVVRNSQSDLINSQVFFSHETYLELIKMYLELIVLMVPDLEKQRQLVDFVGCIRKEAAMLFLVRRPDPSPSIINMLSDRKVDERQPMLSDTGVLEKTSCCRCILQ